MTNEEIIQAITDGSGHDPDLDVAIFCAFHEGAAPDEIFKVGIVKEPGKGARSAPRYTLEPDGVVPSMKLMFSLSPVIDYTLVRHTGPTLHVFEFGDYSSRMKIRGTYRGEHADLTRAILLAVMNVATSNPVPNFHGSKFQG